MKTLLSVWVLVLVCMTAITGCSPSSSDQSNAGGDGDDSPATPVDANAAVPPADVQTVSVIATLVANRNVPDEAVGIVLHGIFDDLKMFQSVHQRLKSVSLATAESDLTIPMHPGATAFYAGETLTPSGDSHRYRISSGGQTGVYYPTAGAIAAGAGRFNSAFELTVQTSGGSTANGRLVGNGDAEFAIMQNDIAEYARTGTLMYKPKDGPGKPFDDLVGVAALYPEHVQIVALARSGIRSVADLAGKKVAIGDVGSGTEANAIQILEAYGMTVDDLARAERLGSTQSRDYLQDARVDAAFFTFGVGTASIKELAITQNIVFVPVDGEARDRLLAKYPSYKAAVIQAGAYREAKGGSSSFVESPAGAAGDVAEETGGLAADAADAGADALDELEDEELPATSQPSDY